MRCKSSILVLCVGSTDEYFDTLAGINRQEKLEIVKVDEISAATEFSPTDREFLMLVDCFHIKIIQESISLVSDEKRKNLSWLFLLDDVNSHPELMSLGNKENVDFQIKPLSIPLFISKVCSLLGFIELKIRLQKEIKKRESALSSLIDEKRYAESLINSSMDMIISVDLNRNILEFNSSAQEAFGYMRDEIIGKPVDILYADRNQSLSVYSNTVKNNRYSAEVLNKRKNGELFPSIISASVLVERDGRKLGLMGISRDISAWKKAESDLKRARDLAESANKAKSEFLANMSHEIRTPMTSVIGYAELLEDQLKHQIELLEFVKIIRRNGEHLLRLMNDILDLSLVERGKLIVKRVSCQPEYIIKNLCYILQSKSDEKSLHFEVCYDGKIPTNIYSDPTRILQCLVNLVGNAIKFTPKGGRICLNVCYFKDSSGTYLKFKVKDSGIGISKEKLSLIMKPFEQGEIPGQNESKGAGLGLSITRSLSELLGGSLSVESTPNVGSEFTLVVNCGLQHKEIKLVDPTEAKDGSPKKSNSVLTSHHPGELRLTGKILLAEDNPDIQKLLKYFLSKLGAEIDTVDNGQLALEKVLNQRYDLIFMDMRMPEMDGITVVKNLRGKGYEGPIVALTASGMRENLQDFLQSGCDEYAVKPISQLKLFELAQRWLEPSDSNKDKDVLEKKSIVGSNESEVSPIEIVQTEKDSESIDKIGDQNQSLIYSTYHEDPEMEDIVIEYVNTLPEKLKKMSKALKRNDFSSLIRIAHGLHGSGGGFGFQVLSDLGSKLEKMIDKNEEKKHMESVLQEFSRIIDRILPVYEVVNEKN